MKNRLLIIVLGVAIGLSAKWVASSKIFQPRSSDSSRETKTTPAPEAKKERPDSSSL